MSFGNERRTEAFVVEWPSLKEAEQFVDDSSSSSLDMDISSEEVLSTTSIKEESYSNDDSCDNGSEAGSEYCAMERILDKRIDIHGKWWYLVKWAQEEAEPTWTEGANIHRDFIREFEEQERMTSQEEMGGGIDVDGGSSGMGDDIIIVQQTDSQREETENVKKDEILVGIKVKSNVCKECGKAFERESGMRIHYTRVHGKKDDPMLTHQTKKKRSKQPQEMQIMGQDAMMRVLEGMFNQPMEVGIAATSGDGGRERQEAGSSKNLPGTIISAVEGNKVTASVDSKIVDENPQELINQPDRRSVLLRTSPSASQNENPSTSSQQYQSSGVRRGTEENVDESRTSASPKKRKHDGVSATCLEIKKEPEDAEDVKVDKAELLLHSWGLTYKRMKDFLKDHEELGKLNKEQVRLRADALDEKIDLEKKLEISETARCDLEKQISTLKDENAELKSYLEKILDLSDCQKLRVLLGKGKAPKQEEEK